MKVLPQHIEIASLFQDSVIIPWPVCIYTLSDSKPFKYSAESAEDPESDKEDIKNKFNGLVNMVRSCPSVLMSTQPTDVLEYGEVDVIEEFKKALWLDPDETNGIISTNICNHLIPELEFNFPKGGSYTLRFGGRIMIEWKVFENKDVYHTCRCFFSDDRSHLGFMISMYRKSSKKITSSSSDQEGQPSFPGVAPSDVYRLFVVKLPEKSEDFNEYLIKLLGSRDLYFRYNPEDPPDLTVLEFGLEGQYTQ